MSLSKGLRLCVLFVMAMVSSYKAHSQEIRVRLLDGKSGKPMAHSCINVWIGDKRATLSIPTDENGVAKVYLTNNASEVNRSNYVESCGMFGVSDPKVMYSDIIQVQAGYAWCNSEAQDRSWLIIHEFKTKYLLDNGDVTQNVCGRASAISTPGELTIFVRPLTLWEKLKQ
jgi:hypothetical protein